MIARLFLISLLLVTSACRRTAETAVPSQRPSATATSASTAEPGDVAVQPSDPGVIRELEPDTTAAGTQPPGVPQPQAPAPGAPTPAPAQSNVTITQPANGSTISSNPFRVAGTARTFENNVVLRVLDARGRVLVERAETAVGELGNFNPWSTEVFVSSDPGERMTIEAIEHSAKDGSVRSHAVVQVTPAFRTRVVTLYFADTSRSPNDCSVVFPVTRTVPVSQSAIRQAVEALLAGPTAGERGQGLSSPFPPGARVRAVNLRDGVATVDFDASLQNVGGSCRAQAIRAMVTRTVGGIGGVKSVRITAGGSEALALQP